MQDVVDGVGLNEISVETKETKNAWTQKQCVKLTPIPWVLFTKQHRHVQNI